MVFDKMRTRLKLYYRSLTDESAYRLMIREPDAVAEVFEASDSGTPNPELVTLLEDDTDEEFEDARHQAIEKLREADIVGFWFQAVGDGSQLDQASGDSLEQLTPDQVAHLAGYADHLDHADVTDIALHLFSHHIGLWVTPLDVKIEPSESPEQPIREELRDFVAALDQVDAARRTESVHLPEPVSLSKRRKQAISLLETDNLSEFWLQLLTDDGKDVIFTVGFEPQFSRVEDIEYVRAVASSMGPMLNHTLSLEFLLQHQLAVAKTTDLPLEMIPQETAPSAHIFNS